MTLKKTRIIAVIGIFILNFIFHFAYSTLPNTLFSIFFPVNESIFEHMKLIFSSAIFYGIIDYFILKKNNLSTNNSIFTTLVNALSTIVIFLIIWLPIYYKMGENMIITILILFIAIMFGQVLSYFILNKEIKFKYLNVVSIISIIIIYIIMAYFTYNPLKVDFFFDPIHEKYGINTYLIK